MTLCDHVGKFIHRRLIRRYVRGKAPHCYKWEGRAARFARAWPWSWRKRAS